MGGGSTSTSADLTAACLGLSCPLGTGEEEITQRKCTGQCLSPCQRKVGARAGSRSTQEHNGPQGCPPPPPPQGKEIAGREGKMRREELKLSILSHPPEQQHSERLQHVLAAALPGCPGAAGRFAASVCLCHLFIWRTQCQHWFRWSLW